MGRRHAGPQIVDIGVEIEVVAIELPRLALPCGEHVETPADVVDQGVVFAQHPGRPLGIPQGCRRFPQHTIPLTVQARPVVPLGVGQPCRLLAAPRDPSRGRTPSTSRISWTVASDSTRGTRPSRASSSASASSSGSSPWSSGRRRPDGSRPIAGDPPVGSGTAPRARPVHRPPRLCLYPVRHALRIGGRLDPRAGLRPVPSGDGWPRNPAGVGPSGAPGLPSPGTHHRHGTAVAPLPGWPSAPPPQAMPGQRERLGTHERFRLAPLPVDSGPPVPLRARGGLICGSSATPARTCRTT